MPALRIFILSILIFCLYLNAQGQESLPKPDFKLFFEKVWLHTDREVYLPGDTVWFKAYLVNARDNVPAFTSGNLYAELFNDTAKLLSSAIIRLEKGSGNGDLALPDSIPAGNYRLRAYTNWMRNFGGNFIFQKDITVLKPPAPTPNGNTAAPVSAITVPASVAAPYTSSSQPTIRFFPEGGQLVEGVSAIVAVKAENAAGNGLSVRGAVLSAANDTVARFNCDALGMGIFVLLPIAGQRYTAAIDQGKGRPVLKINLPAALTNGLALRVRQSDSTLHAIVSFGDLPPGQTTPKFTIVIKHGGKTVINQQVQATGAQTPVVISTKGLPEGVASLTVYNEQNKPECERLIYIHQGNIKPIQLNADKKVYRANESVNISLDAGGVADLSAAVIDALAQPDDADDIVAALMLKSEVRGHIEQAARYFDTTNHNRFKQLDLLLLTQGWRDFIWRRLADTAIRISYMPETGLKVKGQVLLKDNEAPFPLAGVTLYAPAAVGNKLSVAAVDKDGKFEFNNIIQYGTNGVMLTARDEKGKDAGRIKLDTAANRPVLAPLNKINLSSKTEVYAALKSVVAKQMPNNSVIRLKEVNVKNRRRNTFQLRDMNVTSFGYKDEVLVPTANIGSKPTIRDFILQESKQAQLDNMAASTINLDGDAVRLNRIVFFADGKVSDPRLIVNGYEVPVERGPESMKNALYSRYFDLPADKIEKIVIKKMLTPPTIGNASGFVNNSGAITASRVLAPTPIFIIFLTLKPGAMDADRPNSVPLALEGYYQARHFYTPLNEGAARKAGYRTTIHWAPNLKTDATGKAGFSYFNSTSGNVKVVVQGIRTDGTPLSGVLTYKVQ